MMKLNEVKKLLNAEVLCCEERLNDNVKSVFACDLMSDVLAFVEDGALLITGLLNTQTIRTAEMMDISAIVFVRGKKPNEEMINMAIENNIILLTTENILYTSCGILYSNGLNEASLERK